MDSQLANSNYVYPTNLENLDIFYFDDIQHENFRNPGNVFKKFLILSLYNGQKKSKVATFTNKLSTK